MAGDGPADERPGAALATVTAEYATLIIGLLMAKRVLTLRGVSLAMLKTPGAGICAVYWR